MSTFFPFRPVTPVVQAEAAPGCPTGRKCIYLPKITTQGVSGGSSSGSGGDLEVNGIEISQAIQDGQNSVPLVANRATMVRLYARTVGTTQPLSNVKVSVTASNAFNVSSTSTQAYYVSNVPLSYDRGSLQSTINIPLPAAWLNGTVDLTFKLDPDNEVSEANEGNNTITQRFVFQQVPALKITVVPIQYNNTKDGRTYPAPARDTISDWIMRTYPISRLEIIWRSTPYTFTGDLSTSTDFIRLLNEVTSLKSTEKAPESQVYYALVPTSNGSNSWFFSGIAGIGWVGSRTAVGLDLPGSASQIAAHEIGHNLGLSHAPCGGPANPDPNFPNKDGSIGQYGLDVQANQLYAPTTKDVMTYCNPKWISDYAYRKMLSSQMAAQVSAYNLASADTADQGLLVRAQLSAAGVDLKPAYVLPGATSQLPVDSDYLVQVMDGSGKVLSETPVQAFEAETEDEAQVVGINTVIPLADRSAASFRLVKDGKVLAEQALRPAADTRPSVSTAANGGQSVRWADAQQQPALIRYSEDGGSTWTTLGIDITGGELALRAALPKDAIFQVIPAGISQ